MKLDAKKRLAAVVPAGMAICSSGPHHVSKSLEGSSIICRWSDGFYVGVIQRFIPIQDRIDEKNVQIAYKTDNEIVAQYLTTRNYSTDPDAESPAWCLLVQ